MQRTFRRTRGIDRAEAARLLRDARDSRTMRPNEAAERVEWAYAAMPDNLRAIRLRIDLLLNEDNVEAAESLVAKALLQRPTNPSLALLRARCLSARRQWRDADIELRLALGKRRSHRGTLAAAVAVATALGQHVRAAHLLETLIQLSPGIAEYRHQRIAALVEAGAIDDAEAAMRRLKRVPPDLRARVLLAQGRRLETCDALEEAAASVEQADVRDDLLRRLIILLEELGDVVRMRRVVSQLDRSSPGAMLAAARALLGLGEFDSALVHAFALTRVGRYEAEALHTLVVAAALCNRHRLGWRAFRRLQATRRGADEISMAENWRRGLLGRLVRGQQGSRRAGADPDASVLQPLLHHAIAVFERDLARPRAAAGLSNRTEAREHCDRCLAAMGLGAG